MQTQPLDLFVRCTIAALSIAAQGNVPETYACCSRRCVDNASYRNGVKSNRKHKENTRAPHQPSAAHPAHPQQHYAPRARCLPSSGPACKRHERCQNANDSSFCCENNVLSKRTLRRHNSIDTRVSRVTRSGACGTKC